MRELPTDLEILNAIYEIYYEAYAAFDHDKNPTRNTKNFVPIDIDRLAARLRTEPDLLFGRLYQHFEKKHGYKDDGGATMHFFALSLGGRRGREPHCINFPYMSSVLADLRRQDQQYRQTTKIAWLSVVISSVALFISSVLSVVQVLRGEG